MRAKWHGYDLEALKMVYEAGMSLGDLAAQVGVSKSTLRRWLTKVGCTFRGLSAPSRRGPLDHHKAAEIRRLYRTGRYTETHLGVAFGVSQRAISAVVRNQIWKEDGYEGIDRDRCGQAARPHSVRGDPGRVASAGHGQGPGG